MYGYTSHFSSIQEIIKIFIVICWWVLISTHFLSLEKNHLRISKIFQYSGIGQILKWQMLPGQLLPTHEWNLRRWFDKSHSNVSLIVLIILRDTSIEGTQTRKFFKFASLRHVWLQCRAQVHRLHLLSLWERNFKSLFDFLNLCYVFLIFMCFSKSIHICHNCHIYVYGKWSMYEIIYA